MIILNIFRRFVAQKKENPEDPLGRSTIHLRFLIRFRRFVARIVRKVTMLILVGSSGAQPPFSLPGDVVMVVWVLCGGARCGFDVSVMEWAVLVLVELELEVQVVICYLRIWIQ